MDNFKPDLETLGSEPVHSLSSDELEQLKQEYERLKKLVNSGHVLTLQDQRTILQWRRADRETKFILNQVKEKPVKEKVVKVKKPKKLGKKALGLLLIKQMKKEELTEEETRNMKFTLGEEYE
jgi:hypothetical protein